MPLPNVSRETEARLLAFTDELCKWNPRINLVAPSTLPHLNTRHIADSLQLFALRPMNARHWVDLGTGGGFPGLVIAILARDDAPDLRVTLVESDRRKAAFLAAAARAADVRPRILAERAETLLPLHADVLSARAMAPLKQLLGHAERHLRPDGTALFPKGVAHAREIDEALAEWSFTVQKIPSQTDPSGVVLAINGVTRV